MANATSRICTGTISSVIRPSRPALSAGWAKPDLLRSNQPGPATARRSQGTPPASGDRQHAAVPAGRIEGEHHIHHDVRDLHGHRTLQHAPAAHRHDQHQRRADQQQQHDGRARGLHDRLVAVGVRDDHACLPLPGPPEDIARLTIQARAARVCTLACRGSHAGVVELVDTRLRSRWALALGGSSPFARIGSGTEVGETV